MPIGHDASRPEAETTEAMLTASRALLALAVRSVLGASVEVTVAQHRVLVILAAHGPQSVNKLAEHLGVNQSNASRHCSRLQSAGLAHRQRSMMDGRAVEVSITDAGAALVAEIAAARRREIAEVLARMDDNAVRATLRGLSAFNAAAHEIADADWAVDVS